MVRPKNKRKKASNYRPISKSWPVTCAWRDVGKKRGGEVLTDALCKRGRVTQYDLRSVLPHSLQPYLIQWTRLNPLRIMLRTARSKTTDCIYVQFITRPLVYRLQFNTNFHFKMTLQLHCIPLLRGMFRPSKAILRKLLIDWNYRTVSARISIQLHATIIACRCCLWMYIHASLTLTPYCGVHAMFLFCIALHSRACIPCVRDGNKWTSAASVLQDTEI